MYGENTNTMAIPICRVLPYPVIYMCSSIMHEALLKYCQNPDYVLIIHNPVLTMVCVSTYLIQTWNVNGPYLSHMFIARASSTGNGRGCYLTLLIADCQHVDIYMSDSIFDLQILKLVLLLDISLLHYFMVLKI